MHLATGNTEDEASTATFRPLHGGNSQADANQLLEVRKAVVMTLEAAVCLSHEPFGLHRCATHSSPSVSPSPVTAHDACERDQVNCCA